MTIEKYEQLYEKFSKASKAKGNYERVKYFLNSYKTLDKVCISNSMSTNELYIDDQDFICGLFSLLERLEKKYKKEFEEL